MALSVDNIRLLSIFMCYSLIFVMFRIIVSDTPLLLLLLLLVFSFYIWSLHSLCPILELLLPDLCHRVQIPKIGQHIVIQRPWAVYPTQGKSKCQEYITTFEQSSGKTGLRQGQWQGWDCDVSREGAKDGGVGYRCASLWGLSDIF